MPRKGSTNDKVITDCYELLHFIELGKSSIQDLLIVFGIPGNLPESNYRQVERIKQRVMEAGIFIEFDPIEMKFRTETNAKLKYLEKVDPSFGRKPALGFIFEKELLFKPIPIPEEEEKYMPLSTTEEEVSKILCSTIRLVYKLPTLEPDSIMKTCKLMLTVAEYNRMIYILSSLPAAKELMTDSEKTLLAEYERQLIEYIIRNCLIINKGNSCILLRRPEILEVYKYFGEYYIAVTERTLLTIKNNNVIIRELGTFEYLPEPKKSIQAGEVEKDWKLTPNECTKILEKHYLDIEHTEQVNVFYPDRINILTYHNDKFVSAVPEPTSKKSLELRKKKS